MCGRGGSPGQEIGNEEERVAGIWVWKLVMVEEQILESLAWRKGSPVWDAIAESGLPVPTCEDVSLPGQISSESPSGILGPTLDRINLSSPLNIPAQRRQMTESDNDRPALISIQGERHEELPTPCVGITNEAVSSPQSSNPGSIAPGKEADGSLVSPKVYMSPTSIPNAAGKPRRTGSLSLFFRKFYHLASMRMQELCKQLAIDDLHVRRRIWTLFEHVVINHTEFLCERHADQIIMCSVYLMCQVTKNRRSLIDVWESYKRQRQFDLQMYTSVLLSTSTRQLSNGDMFPVDKENQAEGSSIEARGDLGTFHSAVFEPRVISFARRVFGESALNENLKLSPLPTVRTQSSLRLQGIVGNGRLSSPCRRLSDHVYVRSLGQPLPTAPQIPQSPNTAARGLRFIVNCSPTEDLRAINRMIQGSSVDTLRSSSQRTRRVGKRLLVDDDTSVPIASTANRAPSRGAGCRGDERGDSSSPPKIPQMMESPFIARKLQDMLRDRMERH
ncbi:retinoblastoma-like protein 1 [Hetaerina americana]|uniref:retinoblastoma-like protein 1 n=1 Tax=Hetaerina americana TaxID=62018 RepID=UPI003A7F37AE